MSEIIDFPQRRTVAGSCDRLRQVALDALIAIVDAKDLETARGLAVDGLVVICDGSAA
jgi:hypothetical protein